MNRLLELKGRFNHNPNPSSPGPVKLPIKAQTNPITSDHLRKLKTQLEEIVLFWEKNDLIHGALTTVYYREIVAKSNRLCRLLSETGENSNRSIRGAKFNDDISKHIFTYFNTLPAIKRSISELSKVISIVDRNFNGVVTKKDIDDIKIKYKDGSILAETNFCNIIKDAYFVEDFSINRDTNSIKETAIISLYKTAVDTKTLLREIGINLTDEKMIDETTVRLLPNEFNLIIEKAPYLIAMRTNDLSLIKKEDLIKNSKTNIVSIPSPTNEPTIGVIDTLFDKSVYFSEWVQYEDMIDNDIPKDSTDYSHGTSVSSIIVDGPALNKNLDDGCGRFKVKHFGVAVGDKFSSFTILKCIRKAVEQNPSIKVWNLSLGSLMEINPNFISPEAAELDKIQAEKDVVFVVAGTNKPDEYFHKMKIGAPADSINSIVVNSVDFDGKAASYCRVGPVLSFFYKPDVSYYGGDGKKRIRVCSNIGENFVSGTSFAAPWISRKMSYLIDVLGFNREVAKALLIDSAAGWNRKDRIECDIGYGVVPIHINDIVGSKNDEIKFIFTGATELYCTSALNIPVPLNEDGKYPYMTRATLCYYPKCSRSQGVDYTDTEIDFQFGRVKNNMRGNVSLKSFNGNKQGEVNDGTREETARENWRKWDNVKHLANWNNESGRLKTSYEGELCGAKMTVKERLTSQHETIPFGIVITLKEINGINRINDFISRCELKGWFVNQIDIEQRIDVNNKAKEEISFES